MQKLIILPYLCLLICCSTTNNSLKTLTALNGSWTPIKQEIGGKELPSVVFQKEKLVIADSNYTFTAESIDKGNLHYKKGQMDIYGKEGVNAGSHFMAIYKLNKDLLTICYNLKGNSYPPDFETKSNKSFFLTVFKKD